MNAKIETNQPPKRSTINRSANPKGDVLSMRISKKPTNQDLRDAYALFEKRLTTAFAVYAWNSQVHPKLEDRCTEIPSYITMVENAMVMGTLMCIRSLDDFFLCPEAAKFDDDIIAHDFGFTDLGSSLGEPERVRINRLIVHMSYAPIWDSLSYVGPNGDESFDVRSLLSRMVPRCLKFLDFLVDSPLFSGRVSLSRIRKLRRIIKVTLGNVQHRAKLQLRAEKQ